MLAFLFAKLRPANQCRKFFEKNTRTYIRQLVSL